MTYGITADGFNLKTFDVLRAEIEAYQRLHITAGLTLSDDTSLGNANVAHINQLAEAWEALQEVYSSNDPDVATEWSLVQLCALTGTSQSKYSKTQVLGTVTMNPNKALPAGSIANLVDKPNTRFLTTTEVLADPSGGTFDVIFEAENAGATSVEIGQLAEINVAVSGWTAVTNAVQGVVGSEPETNEELRDKRETELAQAGSANLDAIISEVSDTTNVLDVDGRENDNTGTNTDIPKNSVNIVVRGGTDAAVAQAIYDSKAGGIRAYGTTVVQVADSKSRDHAIGFTRGTALPFYCDISLEVTDDWNGATSEAEVKAAISAYANSLNMGEDVIYSKVSAVAFLIVGVYKVSALTIGFSAAPTGTIDLAVTVTQYVESDVANIAVTVVP